MNLDALFREVRELYFPRWDAKGEWSCRWGSNDQRRNHTGYCDTAIKTIFLDKRQVVAMSPEGAKAFLIHEICHDVGSAFHIRAWCRRMEKAAKRAEVLGDGEVAEILRSDIVSCGGDGILEDFSRENVRELVAELYWSDGVRDTDVAIKRVAKHFGHAIGKVRRDFGDDIEAELNDQH